jgi:hypothetical protein
MKIKTSEATPLSAPVLVGLAFADLWAIAIMIWSLTHDFS